MNENLVELLNEYYKLERLRKELVSFINNNVFKSDYIGYILFFCFIGIGFIFLAIYLLICLIKLILKPILKMKLKNTEQHLKNIENKIQIELDKIKAVSENEADKFFDNILSKYLLNPFTEFVSKEIDKIISKTLSNYPDNTFFQLKVDRCRIEFIYNNSNDSYHKDKTICSYSSFDLKPLEELDDRRALSIAIMLTLKELTQYKLRLTNSNFMFMFVEESSKDVYHYTVYSDKNENIKTTLHKYLSLGLMELKFSSLFYGTGLRIEENEIDNNLTHLKISLSHNEGFNAW